MRDSSTLLHRLYLWASDQPESPAHHFRPDRLHWRSISAKAFWLQVVRIALHLKSLYPDNPPRVLIYASNSPEWIQWELGTVLAGGQSIGVHPSVSEIEFKQILEETEPSLVVLESNLFRNQLNQALQQIEAEHSRKTEVLAWTFQEAAEQVLAKSVLDDYLTLARGEKLLQVLQPDSPQFIVYTSGTMGKPKGVLLSIDHLTRVADTLTREWNLPYMGGTLFSFLPLAHVAEKVQTLAVALSLRYPVFFNSRYDRFIDELKEVRPTILLAVPRVWEKIKEGVESHKPKILHTLKEIDVLGPIAEKVFLSQVRGQMGMDRLQLAVSGAAKLSPSLGEWYQSIGIEIQEIYGMSETSGLISLTHPGRQDFKLIGRPASGVEVELSPEGEIWVKSPFNFSGYFKNDEETQKVLVRDGWVKTGDLAEWVSREGAEPELHLIGRNREILKLSNGKMVAPVPIENALKSIPEVSNVCLMGENRPELMALLTLKEQALLEVKFVPGAIEGISVEDESMKKRIEKAIQQLVDSKQIAHPIKKFVILSRDFSAEKGELTSTQKLNRRNIQKNFQHFIDLYYQD